MTKEQEMQERIKSIFGFKVGERFDIIQKVTKNISNICEPYRTYYFNKNGILCSDFNDSTVNLSPVGIKSVTVDYKQIRLLVALKTVKIEIKKGEAK